MQPLSEKRETLLRQLAAMNRDGDEPSREQLIRAVAPEPVTERARTERRRMVADLLGWGLVERARLLVDDFDRLTVTRGGLVELIAKTPLGMTWDEIPEAIQALRDRVRELPMSGRKPGRHILECEEGPDHA